MAESLAKHQERLSEAKTKLGCLLQLVEGGLMESSDPTLAERLEDLRGERNIAQKEVNTALAELAPKAKLTEEKISDFIDLMRKKLTEGDIELRRAYLRAVVDNVEIEDTEIRTHGRKNRLEQAILQQDRMPASVPTFVREWRSDRDSNPGDGFPPTHFPGVRLRPLGHRSVGRT